MTDSAVTVVVVDDQRLIRESIAALLDLQPGITVVGRAADGEESLRVVEETAPDVVLMDVRMPHMDGLAAASELQLRMPQCRILMLTTFDDESYVRAAVQGGAIGYLLKDRPIDEIAAAVRTAKLGVAQFDPAALARLATAGAPRTSEAFKARLSEREIHVLRELVDGKTNREIARSLHLSEGTVKNHVSSILERLGARHRTHAAVLARDHGLV